MLEASKTPLVRMDPTQLPESSGLNGFRVSGRSTHLALIKIGEKIERLENPSLGKGGLPLPCGKPILLRTPGFADSVKVMIVSEPRFKTSSVGSHHLCTVHHTLGKPAHSRMVEQSNQ